VGLHGGDDDDLGWAVGGFVGEEEQSVAEGGNESEDGRDSQRQCWLHGFSVGWIRGPMLSFGFDVEELGGPGPLLRNDEGRNLQQKR